MVTKVVFFGSDEYSVIVLNQLYDDKRFKIVSVVHTSPSPVEDYAKTLFEIKFTSIKKIDKKFALQIIKVRPDVGILASFGKILPKETLDVFPRGVLNIHPSLLPKYRGPTPVQAAILNGDKETGVTIIKMDEKTDHGPILAQSKEKIHPKDTTESLYKRLFATGAEVLTTVLPTHLEGRIKLREQNHSKATYTKKLSRVNGKIDWQKSNNYLERFIRAMFPWPGAWTMVRLKNKKKRLKILKAHLEPTIQDRKAKPLPAGKAGILDRKKLVVDQVQLEGKKPVTWKQFCEGYPEAKIIRSS